MAKKWSQFDEAGAIVGSEEFVGLQGGNVRFSFADVLAYFEAEFGSTNFWPLAGAADQTNDVTIDGNDHDLILGSPNSLDDFQVYANNQILLEVDDTVESSSIYLDPDVLAFVTVGLFSLSVDDGSSEGAIDVNPDSIIFGVSDGVDSSSLTLTPLGLSIDYIEGGESTLNGSWNILGQSTWDINLGTVPSPLSGLDVYVSSSVGWTADDGVDSSNISLIPTGLVIPSFTVAGAPSASPAAKIAYCSDESGGATPVYSDNTNWRRIYDGQIIS